jgi:sugar/nucleoside kinase (ribokinase family)
MPLASQAVVAGHICLDVIPTFATAEDRRTELPAPGQLVQVGPAILSTGGLVSNTGLALHLLGVETRLMGKVGDDAFGRVVVDLIRSRRPSLADGIIMAPGESTSYSIVLSLPGRDRSFLHWSGANDTFCASDLKLETIEQTRLFHFGYPPVMARMYASDGAELSGLFRTVKALGVTTSLDMVMVDPSSPAGQANWEMILRATLPHVDVFLPSIEELLLLLRRSEYNRLTARGPILDQISPALLHEMADTLLAWGVKIVGLKMGYRGMYLRTAGADKLVNLGRAAPEPIDVWSNRELWAPIFQVARLGGTTGAGDATIAGFLAALLVGRSPEDTLTFACAVGACNVEAADALSGLRSWDQTWARIKSGWARVVRPIDDPTWRWDSRRQLWIGPSDPL